MDRKLLQYLVEYLVEEGKAHGCALPPAAADAAQGGLASASTEALWLAFRSLVNVRPPWPAPGEFLATQDELLQGLIAEAGVATLADATPSPTDPRLRLWRGDITTYGAEIDPESVEYLHAHFPEFAPRLIEGDFLKMNLRERFPRGLKIIGNFPYNISSQIFFKVLEHRDLVPECVGMIQKEVAVRIAEPPGSKEYGILSVLLQAWYDIEYLFTVNETVFNPPPKVKSAFIRLRRNSVGRLGCDEALFVKVVKASFGQRRKMIRNSLRAVFGDFGGAEHPFFTQRAEQLSVADFVQLTDWVAANRK